MSFSVQPLYVFLVAVSCGVHEVFAGSAVAYNAYTLPGQAILHFLHLKFVSGNYGGRKYYSISLLQGKFGVGLVGGAVERREFFTLSSGHQNHDFIRRIISYFFERYYRSFLRFEHSGFDRYLDICFHGASIQCYFLAQRFGEFYHMGEACDMRGKSGNDHPALHFSYQIFQSLMHFYLRQGKSFVFNISGVCQEKQHFRFIKNGVFFFFLFRDYAVYLVELVVAGSNYPSIGSFYDDSHRIGDSVGYSEKSRFYFSKGGSFVFFHYYFFHGWKVGEFRLTLSHHQYGELSRIDGRVADAREYQRYPSDVVQVPVSDDERAYFFFAFFEVSGVRNDIIHSRRRFVREMHAGIYDNDVVSCFYCRHIFAYFFHSSQRNNTYYSGFRRRNFFTTASEIFMLTLGVKRAGSASLPKPLFGILVSGTFCRSSSMRFSRCRTSGIQTSDIWAGLFGLDR